MDQAIERRRNIWLGIIKAITEKCFEREARLGDLCPQRYSMVDKDNRRAALKAIATLTQEIASCGERLRQLERGGGIGFSVVFGRSPTSLEQVVLSLMTAARFDASAASQLRSVLDVINFAAVRDPSTADQVRCLYRSDSAVFPFFVLGKGYTLDLCSCTLREKMLNRILARPADETEARCEAEALVGGKGR